MKAATLRAAACLSLLVCAPPLWAAPPKLEGAGVPLLPVDNDFIPDLQIWVWGWSPKGAVLIVSWQMYEGDVRVTVWDAVRDRLISGRSVDPAGDGAPERVQKAIAEAAAAHGLRAGAGTIGAEKLETGGRTYRAGLGNGRVNREGFRVFDVSVARGEGGRTSGKKIGEFVWFAPARDDADGFRVEKTHYVLSPFERRMLAVLVYASPHLEFDWDTYNFSMYGCALDEGFKPEAAIEKVDKEARRPGEER